MLYEIKPPTATLLVAWGPPYTPSRAARFAHEAASASANAMEMELCKSGEGRGVPMLFISEGDRGATQRFGIWVQARQHAWECGSSWVCEGFAEWLLGDDPAAQWLRQNAEIYIVPIMDVDNCATGNGGKDAVPQDHNRDWSDKPHWKEVAAAQKEVAALAAAERMDVFLDLHNPSPSDKKAFFYDAPPSLYTPQTSANRDRFFKLALEEITPAMPMLNQKSRRKPDHPIIRSGGKSARAGLWPTAAPKPSPFAWRPRGTRSAKRTSRLSRGRRILGQSCAAISRRSNRAWLESGRNRLAMAGSGAKGAHMNRRTFQSIALAAGASQIIAADDERESACFT